MNKRIKELFDQALEEFNAENKYATIIVPNPLKEKFAELIIRECARINFSNIVGIDPEDDAAVGRAIKKHFGVEE